MNVCSSMDNAVREDQKRRKEMAENKMQRPTDINRDEWDRMISVDPKTIRVPKSEVVAWLKKHGRELNTLDAIQILRVYFDVQIGDTIITHIGLNKGIPADAEQVVVTGGNKHRRFTLQNIGRDNGKMYIVIKEREEVKFTGAENSSGIFYFFLHEQFYIIRKIENAD